MKECASIREQLSAYLDNVLAPGEAGAVEEHLKECRSCAAALDDLRKVVSHLHKLEQVDPPPWFTQKVMSRVREAGAAEKRGLFAWLAAPMYIKLPVGALATVVLAVTTYFVLHGIMQEMPVEKEKQGQEVSSSPAPAAPAKSEKPSKPAPERQAGKADVMRAKAIEPAARPMERAMREEAPVRSAKSIPKTDSGYAPAPPAEYKTGTSAPQRAPETRAETSAPAAQYKRSYQQSGSVAKSKKAMAAPGDSTANRDMAAKSSEGEYRSERQERPLMAENVPVTFHLSAADPADAGRRVADVLRQFSGKNIKTEPGEGRLTVKADLQINFVDPLYEKLKAIGKVREQKSPQLTDVNSVAVAVEIAETK